MSVKKNYLYNTVFQILKVSLPILTAPYIARVLGANGNGIYGFTISVTAYFIIVGCMGIDLYGQREIAYAQNDKKRRNAIFWELFLFKLISMAFVTVVFFFSFGMDPNYKIYYRILLFEMIGNALDITWFFQGMENFRQTTIRNILIKLASVVCVFVFVKSPNDVWIYLLIYSLSVLFGSLALWPLLIRQIEKPLSPRITRHIRPAFSVFLPQIAEKVYTVLDKTMIGWITLSMSEVGYYEQSQKIIKIILTVITSLGIVMLPRIASCFAKNDESSINKYLKKAFHFVLISACPLLFGMIAVSDRFVPLFFGDGYEKAAIIIKIISPITLFIGLTSIIGIQYLIPTKRQKEFTASIVVGAIVNTLLNLALIPLWQSYGAAIATVFAEFSVLLVQYLFTKRNIDYAFVFGKTVRYLLYGAVMLVACKLIELVTPDNAIGLIAECATGALIYLALVMASKDSIIDEAKRTIKSFKK